MILNYSLFCYSRRPAFFQFFNNGRHKGHSARDVALFVGVSNLTWLVFPLWGLYASIQLILDGSYGVFL